MSERMAFQDWIDGAVNDFEDGASDGREFRSAIMDIMLKILEPVEALEKELEEARSIMKTMVSKFNDEDGCYYGNRMTIKLLRDFLAKGGRQ